MALRRSSIFALGAVLALARRVDDFQGDPALLEAGEAEPAEEKCPSQGWQSAPRPTASESIGKYTLVECLGGRIEGESWKAKSKSDEKEVVLKVLKPPAGESAYGPPSKDRECLFGQMAARRDPEHFLDCIEVGTDDSGDTAREFVVFEPFRGKEYLDWLMEKDQKTWTQLKPVVSFWIELVSAYEAGYKTTSEDHFKLIHPTIDLRNIVVDLESEKLGLKIINYGKTRICCIGGQPEDCKASLRQGTTTTPPTPETFAMCEAEDPKYLSPGDLAKWQRKSLSDKTAMILDRYALSALMKGSGGFKAAIETVASGPGEYLVADLKAEFANAEPQVRSLFTEVFAMLLGLMTEDPERAQVLDTLLPSSLLGKLQELHGLLGS